MTPTIRAYTAADLTAEHAVYGDVVTAGVPHCFAVAADDLAAVLTAPAGQEREGFESGPVAQFFGPIVAVVSGGVGTLIVVAVTAWASPTLRRFGSLGEIHTKD